MSRSAAKTVHTDLGQARGYTHMDAHYDADTGAVWFRMHGEPRPSFTPTLLREMQDLFDFIRQVDDAVMPVRYLVAASAVPGVYNLGGDLAYFRRCIEARDAEALREYAYSCLRMEMTCVEQFGKGVTSYALIQGSALGGGFEAPLSCDYIVAERSAQIGFPEILFDLFPGMGAMSFLSRRVSPAVAERLITSGCMYTAAELHELGVVDILAEDGEGEAVLRRAMAEHRSHQRGRGAARRARNLMQPITFEELARVADLWVEAALEVDGRALKVMERIVRSQDRRRERTMQRKEEPAAETA